MKTIIAILFAVTIHGATNTNAVVRPPVNQFQLFYTNWVRQYNKVCATIRTNEIQKSRQWHFISQTPEELPRRATDYPVKHPQRKAAEDALAEIEKAGEPARNYFKGLVDQRMAFELKYPKATDFAPPLRKWTELPKVDYKF